MTYDLFNLQYCFCVLRIYTHKLSGQSVKSNQTTSMINPYTYDDTTHTLQTLSFCHDAV